MKDDLLIITWAFFNKYGNQSFYESVIGYCEKFNVTIITSANLDDDMYYTTEEIRQRIPSIRIIKVRSRIIDIAREIGLNRVQSIGRIFKVKEHESTKNADYIKNTPTSILEYLAYIIHNRILYNTARNLIVNENYAPRYVCAYETGGIIPTILLKEREIPTAVTFGKFQGTVLGSVLDRLNDPEIVKMFRIEIHGMQHAKMLNACIMTNDGTKGKDILRHFLVDDDNILFITNGIPNHLAAVKQRLGESQKPVGVPIYLFTLSRFTYWKRVYLAVEVVKNLVHDLQDFRYRLNIYGIGSPQEVEDLEVMIKRYNLDDYVKIRGEVPFSEIFKVFHENDILLSLYMFSNLCNPVLESAYLSKPIITIQQDDLVEIFNEPSNKLILMDEINEKDLVSAISHYLHHMSTPDIAALINSSMGESFKILTWQDRIEREIEFITSK
jgi:glycosyltransferase involved in cell wall biosynthesis